MKFLGNIIWLLFGGIIVSILYLIGSFILIVTIIGIPFGLQTLKLANLALWPFGRDAVYRPHEPGCLGVLMNILWILCGGVWIAVTHLIFALFFFITIIGIPFALQHMKLASVALVPFGREIRLV